MKSNVLWLFFLFLTFIVTLPISWFGMSKMDFFYSSLHDNIGIDQHIQTYAPSNRFAKTEFEETTKDERVNLFRQVVISIHNNGDGLESLFYRQKSNNQKMILFTDAEVIHLKDVAVLLNKIKPMVFSVLLIWLLLIAWIFLKKYKLPSMKRFALYGVILLLIMCCVLLLGPEKVFNQLHIWAFPDNHQWFFYYEDSLMSTMMKAPHLFAYISVIWMLISIFLTIVLLKCMHLFQVSSR